MATTSRDQVTQLLLDWSEGNEAALQKLIPLVQKELHRLAPHYMAREHRHFTLQSTVLVNEAYLRLLDSSRVRWQNRAQFFAISAQLMRRVLVDFARSRQAAKRGGEAWHVGLEEAAELPLPQKTDLVALDEALNTLASMDP